MANQGAVVIFFDRERFARAPDILTHIIESHLDKLGRDIATWIFEHAPKDTGINAESVGHIIEPVGNGGFQLVIFSNVPGARYALETGRRPGRKPPLNKILGWVKRKGFTEQQRGQTRAVGRRVGASYRSRRTNADAVTFDVLLNSSLEGIGAGMTKGELRAAYRIQKKIGRRGTKAPHIFTRAITETRELQVETIQRINRDGSRFI